MKHRKPDMGRKKWWKPVALILGILIFLAAAFIATMGILSAKGYGLSVGRCLIDYNGSCILVVGDTPIYMSGDDKQLEGLEKGDKLIVLHGGIEESYPARTGVYFIFRYGSGDTEGLDQVLDSFTVDTEDMAGG